MVFKNYWRKSWYIMKGCIVTNNQSRLFRCLNPIQTVCPKKLRSCDAGFNKPSHRLLLQGVQEKLSEWDFTSLSN